MMDHMKWEMGCISQSLAQHRGLFRGHLCHVTQLDSSKIQPKSTREERKKGVKVKKEKSGARPRFWGGAKAK